MIIIVIIVVFVYHFQNSVFPASPILPPASPNSLALPYSLPQIRRQRELPRTSEVCPYIVKNLILRTLEVVLPRG